MTEPKNHLATPDPWRRLRELTPARIALGRAGGSTPTGECLDFRLAHARARDAVHAEFDAGRLSREISALGLPTLCLRSGAHDRAEYLKRPDLGRTLDASSQDELRGFAKSAGRPEVDLAIVVSDGLSALAAERQVAPLLAAWLPLVRSSGWRLSPAIVVSFGRVAIEDEIGKALRARVAVILLGERPGLGSPDSLSAYLVFDPRVGRTDAERNCISNIRPQGLPPETAALKLHYLVGEALSRKISGVALKDESLTLSQAPDAASLQQNPGGS